MIKKNSHFLSDFLKIVIYLLRLKRSLVHVLCMFMHHIMTFVGLERMCDF